MKNTIKLLGVGVAFFMLSFAPPLNATENIAKMEVAYDATCVPVSLSCRDGEVCGISTEQILSQVAYAEEYWWDRTRING